MSKKRSLGRGLGAILEEVEKAYENNIESESEIVQEIPIDLIDPNPYQPRKKFDKDSLDELANSIKEHGLIQPIIVYEDNNRYVLIAGERRVRASKIAELTFIKAIIADLRVDKLREYAIIENIQREDLNPVELAKSFQELIDEHNLTHEELSKKVSKSRSQISNILRVLNLSDETKNYLIENKISLGHAKLLIPLSKDEEKIVVDSIVGQKLSVRESEKLIKKLKDQKIKSKDGNTIDTNIDESDYENLKSLLDKHKFKYKLSKNSLTIQELDNNRMQNLINMFKMGSS